MSETTQSPPFVHLRMHTEYSVSDGIVQIKAAVARAYEYAMPALGISDLGNLFAMVKFYKAARSKGIKPIIGADVWLFDERTPDQSSRCLLICLNRRGYGQLCELLTRAFIEHNRHGRAQINKAWLGEMATSDLLCLSGAMDGDIAQAFAAGKDDWASTLASEWQTLFPNRFYIELQRAGRPGTETYIQQVVALALTQNLPLVATHPVQFITADDFRAHEARVCIAEGSVLADQRRRRDFTAEQYFKSPAEMTALFADLPQALENSLHIAARANLTVQLGKNFLPQFPTPAGVGLDDFLRKEAASGLELRLTELYPDEAERDQQRSQYDERLHTETETIIAMGFSGYFLIVADFINWAKANGVPVGPGRGSGAGSLVAFSLRITDIDPLAYALLFERFLNPERVSMPDFDIDFCQEKRYLVIDYVRQRYGKDAVSQIATFGTMASKAVIRDVGRVLDLPYGLCDRLSKLIPVEQNKPLGLTEAREREPQIGELMNDANDGESVAELWELALPLEGLVRGVGMHAGGVLIAPGKLTDFCPLYIADGADAASISQFDKDDVEAVGLVKFDFLGLRNLTIIDLAIKYITEMTGETIDLNRLGFNDSKTYQVLKDANTNAIFQLESEGMKKLLRNLGPDRFEDIIAVLALYRPGPLGSGMVDDFVLRKKGKQKINYFDDALKACLEPTYGVIVYQEQVMQISQIIGGYTLGGADMLRRAMGKKKPEEMAKHRETMRAGAIKQGFEESLAMQLFDLMEKFAEYGFNKSHTAAYAVITYQTAWLKAHHCAAFMAATLSTDMDNTDAVKIFYEDTVANKVKVLPPSINESVGAFKPVDEKSIRYGLGALKGVGLPAADAIVAARASGGPFTSLFDFCERVDRRMVNKRVLESLVRAGAFDELNTDRAKLFANIGLAMEAAEQAAANAMQSGLFDDLSGDEASAIDYLPAAPWSEREQLREEKTALGFFYSGHPFSSYSKEIRRFVRTKLGQIVSTEFNRGANIMLISGTVVDVRHKITGRGKMAFVVLDDGSATVEMTMYSEVFDRERYKLKIDEPLIAEVKITKDDYNGGNRITCESAMSLAEARTKFAEAIEIRLNKEQFGGTKDCLLTDLGANLTPFKGGECPVRIFYENDLASGMVILGKSWEVVPEEPLLESLRDRFGAKAVELVY